MQRRSAARTLLAALAVTTLATFSLTGLATAPAQATTPGTPGVPQASTVIYDEDFENRPAPTPIVRLSEYVGASGQRYTADPEWLTMCNGWIAAFNQPVAPAAQLADCAGAQQSWNSIQQLTYGLGAYAGDPDPQSNFSVSAFTAGNPGAGNVEFETATNIPFAGNGRFVTFSVDVAAVNCQVSPPLLQFLLIDGAGNAIPAGSQVDGCQGSQAVRAPAIGVSAARDVTVGTTVSNGSVLVNGTSVGVRMLNNNASGAGNDHAFDNLRIIDATPQLDKSFAPASVVAGSTSTLTFTITNTTELAAKNGWSFTDALPVGLTIADDSAATTCPAGVVTAPAGATAVTVTGNLAQGMAACTVTVKVTSPDAGVFTNGPDNITSVGLNPPADTTVEFVEQAPAISVVKSASPSSEEEFVLGQEITYSFVVTNTGNVPLTDVEVDEGEFTGSGQLSEIVCPAAAANLAPNAQVTCTATYSVTQQDVDAGSITNSATATGVPPEGEPPVSPPSEVTVPAIDPAPALTIDKSATPATIAEAGETVTYSFVLTNTGNVTLTDVGVVEGEFTGTGELSDVVCPPAAGSLAPGASVTCTAMYTVTQADVDAGSISNTATGTGTPPDPNTPPPVSPPDEVTIEFPPAPGITVVKTADEAAQADIAVGQVVTYSFLVTNTGNVTLSDVTVVEGAFSGAGDLSEITCPAGAASLAPGAQIVCTATYTVLQEDVDAGSITNSATGTGTPPDPNTPPPVSPPSEVTVPGNAQPALDVVKTASVEKATAVGQAITYSFQVTNTGNVTLSDVSVDEGEFTGTGTLSEVVCPAEAQSMAPGAQVTCTATYTVTQADLDAGSLRNTATGTGTTPGGGTVTSDPSSVTVDTPGAPDLAVTGAGVPVGLAAAALTLLALGAGLLAVRRRAVVIG